MIIPGTESRDFWMLITMVVFATIGSLAFYLTWKSHTSTQYSWKSIFKYGILGVCVGCILWGGTNGGEGIEHHHAALMALACGANSEYLTAMWLQSRETKYIKDGIKKDLKEMERRDRSL